MPGTAPACTLWQRINVMQALRSLSGDAYILYFLFTTYDLKQARLQPHTRCTWWCPWPGKQLQLLGAWHAVRRFVTARHAHDLVTRDILRGWHTWTHLNLIVWVAGVQADS